MLQMITKLKLSYFMGGFKTGKKRSFSLYSEFTADCN